MTGVKVPLALLLCGACIGVACAQPYPTKPIRFIVGFGAGGGNDMIARTLSRKLTESLGQQVIVDNRAGGAGIVAAVLTAKAPPDGYTVFAGSISTLATNVSMHSKLPYDPLRDFAPVTTTTLSPYLCVVNPTVPAATLKEFIALAKAAPGKISYASAGSGSGNHLSHELFKFMAGIDMVHVPYKGGGPAITALLSGQVQVYFAAIPSTLPFIKGGRLRALAVTSAKRSPAVPEVPSMAEAGVAGYDELTWNGLLAPARLPAPLLKKIYGDVEAVLKTPFVRDKFATEGAEPGSMAPEAFGKLIQSEIVKWAKLTREVGIKPE